jgi:NADPH-dependent glutamate synthase beta subunit-like oxidoreductase/NAD-dependent dihydropyrimidine dehydrogenase PreA subunit
MPKLFIDNREVEVDKGATILDAADRLGIEIPTMCFLKNYKPSTSCMVCVVKVKGLDNLVPACGTIAKDGMRVESDSEQVLQARKAALELLLSDHVGDCLGPCQVICPARMNIPLMIRQISAGKFRDAIATVKKDIALPAVLGRICPKPCERGCRRGALDQAVSICLLKRYIADLDLQSANPYLPTCKPTQEKRVAVVGAGPAGLAAAYYLQQAGFCCTVFDDHEKPGGMLRYAVPKEHLPIEVLDKEIALIEKVGIKFKGQTRIGTDLLMEDLRRDFDAVFVAVGQLKPGDAKSMGLKEGTNGIAIDNKTYQTNLQDIFAGGDAVHKRKLTVRAVADGKEAAVSISQYLSGCTVTGPVKEFNTRIGKLMDGEIEKFLTCSVKAQRTSPSGKDGGFTNKQARKEATRCLHCDCRKADTCKLRQYAQDYGARPSRYKGQRRLFAQQVQSRTNCHLGKDSALPEVQTGVSGSIGAGDIIYEPGKCIDCGLCIQTAARAGEELGLTFIGRGFDVRVAVPFDRLIAQALKHSADQCVNACPTGALAFRI